MALLNPIPAYQPLFHAPDRLVRVALPAWQRQVLAALQRALATSAPALQSIEPLLNLLALFEAYRGDHARALRVSEAQIRFWKHAAAGDAALLNRTIQPWINVIRLERWQGKFDSSAALYREFAPTQRDLPGTLQARYGVTPTLAGLAALDEVSDFNYDGLFDGVYWHEYGGLLLRAGRLDALRAHVIDGLRGPAGGFAKLSLIENLLAGRAAAGHHDGALKVLASLKTPQHAPYWLHLKTIEVMLLSARDGAAVEASEMLFQAALSGQHGNGDVHEAALLIEITRLLDRLGLEAQAQRLAARSLALARAVGDEVLHFEAAVRCADSDGLDVRAMFADSGYALIRRRLGLPLAAAQGPDVVAAMELLADLRYRDCAVLLEAAAAPQCA